MMQKIIGLYFRSTQRRRLYFYVEVDEKDSKEMKQFLLGNEWVWDWFKKQRTNFLIEYHPTIDAGYEKFELK